MLLHNKFFVNGGKILLQSQNEKIITCIFSFLIFLVFKNESVFKISNKTFHSNMYFIKKYTIGIKTQ